LDDDVAPEMVASVHYETVWPRVWPGLNQTTCWALRP